MCNRFRKAEGGKGFSLILNIFYDKLSVILFIKRNIMAYTISSECINCGACEGECPSGAISEKDGRREIAADTCVSCGACASVCPVSAISEE